MVPRSWLRAEDEGEASWTLIIAQMLKTTRIEVEASALKGHRGKPLSGSGKVQEDAGGSVAADIMASHSSLGTRRKDRQAGQFRRFYGIAGYGPNRTTMCPASTVARGNKSAPAEGLTS